MHGFCFCLFDGGWRNIELSEASNLNFLTFDQRALQKLYMSIDGYVKHMFIYICLYVYICLGY